jgi:DDE superfamily endonuclease
MEKLEALMQQYNFPPQLIFNFDETMLDPGHPRVKVISRSKRPRPFLEIAAKGEHITFGLCISAAGTFIRPLCILPLVNLPDLPREVTSFFNMSGQENGFITKEIFFHWVQDVYIPFVENTRRQLGCPNQAALLIVDSHNSRDHSDTIKLCKQHNIIVLVLLAHSSTILQPLDLSVNKKLKEALQENFEPKPHESVPEKRSRLLYTSIFCLQIALNALPIKRGFARAGIWPFVKEAPLNSHLVRSPANEVPPVVTTKKNKRRRIAGVVLTPENTHTPLPSLPSSKRLRGPSQPTTQQTQPPTQPTPQPVDRIMYFHTL